MGTVVALLLLIAGANPMEFDKPVVNIDGYIELNHYWTESSNPVRTIKGKDVYHGYCNYDQIIIWQYNNKTGFFDVVHQNIIRDSRLKSRLTGEKLEAHNKKIYSEWEKAHIKAAKDLDCSVEDVIVYHDSPFVGGQGVNQVSFNQNTKKYEVFMKAYYGRYLDEPLEEWNKEQDENTYKFTANNFYETNTLYSVTNEDSRRREVGFMETNFFGTRHIFQEMQLRKKGVHQRVEPITPYGWETGGGE